MATIAAKTYRRGGTTVTSNRFFTARVEGGPELARALQSLVKGLRDDLLKEATLAGAEVIADEWRARVPVDEGDYRNSIAASSRAGKNGATAIVAVSKKYEGGPGDAFEDINARAVLLEYGSRSRGARPSARPAFDNGQQRAVSAVEAKLRELIEAAVS